MARTRRPAFTEEFPREAVKREFGNWLIRLLRGGTTLSAAEHFVLVTLVESLDAPIRSVVKSHFSEYNLVQREVDGRALNFYKIGARGRKLEVSNPLEMENRKNLC